MIDAVDQVFGASNILPFSWKASGLRNRNRVNCKVALGVKADSIWPSAYLRGDTTACHTTFTVRGCKRSTVMDNTVAEALCGVFQSSDIVAKAYASRDASLYRILRAVRLLNAKDTTQRAVVNITTSIAPSSRYTRHSRKRRT